MVKDIRLVAFNGADGQPAVKMQALMVLVTHPDWNASAEIRNEWHDIRVVVLGDDGQELPLASMVSDAVPAEPMLFERDAG